MSNFIEELYYGNLEPQSTTSVLNYKMKKQLDKLVQKEEALRGKINDETKELFESYTNAYNEFLSTCCADSFVIGFKFGGKFAIDTFAEL